jgi:hypothetical protein
VDDSVHRHVSLYATIAAPCSSSFRGIIELTAGALLLRARLDTDPTIELGVEPARFQRASLQLLGVYFLISGLMLAARPTVAVLFYSAAWQTTAGEFLGASVSTAGGLFLITRPVQIAHSFDRFRRVYVGDNNRIS